MSSMTASALSLDGSSLHHRLFSAHRGNALRRGAASRQLADVLRPRVAVSAGRKGSHRSAVAVRASSRLTVSAAVSTASSSPVVVADSLLAWLSSAGLPPQPVKVAPSDSLPSGVAFVASRDISPGEAAFSVPENFCVTSLDVANHPVVAPLSAASAAVPIPDPAVMSFPTVSLFTSPASAPEIAGLAWWLLYECHQGEASAWHPFLCAAFPELMGQQKGSSAGSSSSSGKASGSASQVFSGGALPVQVASPLLWTAEQRQWLKGTSIAAATEAAVAYLSAQHAAAKSVCLDADPASFPASQPSDPFSLSSVLLACALVSARAIWLPSAGLHALVPLAHYLPHSAASAAVDFDLQSSTLQLRATEPIKAGQPITRCFRPDCPPAQLLLSHALLPSSSPPPGSSPLSGDWLPLTVGLLPVDPLRGLKRSVLADAGLADPSSFPLFPDRFPRQLIAFMRLQRLADAAQLAGLSFVNDSALGEMNEYESLSVLLSMCTEGQTSFPQTLDDDQRLINILPSDYASEVTDGGGSKREVEIVREWLAAQVRVREKGIWAGTVAAVRRRLAPIRGLPSKQGMADPNAEIKEMFGAMEVGLAAPMKLLGGLFNKKQ